MKQKQFTRQRYYKKRKLQANISDEYKCKNPQQNISKPNSTIYKKDHTPWSSGIYSRYERTVQYPQINQYICQINKRNNRNHTIILIEKTFDKIKHSFMIKSIIIVDIEGTYLNITKAIYDTANIILNGEKLNAFPLKLGKKASMLTFTISI